MIGECIVDLAPRYEDADDAAPPERATGTGGATAARLLSAMPGGSPANVAVGLARLGVATAFAGRLSTSGMGPWLRAHLAANGLDLSLSVSAHEPATLALVTLDDLGGATYAFYGPSTADWQWQPDELPLPSSLGPGGLGFTAVHTGSLAAALGPGSAVVGHWLAEVRESTDLLVSFDPNVRPGLAAGFDEQRAHLTQMLASAHLVKASHEDVEALAPGAGPQSAAQQWLAAGAELVVVTEGSQGATAYQRGGFRCHGRPPRVDVADTIGAGDSFMSALLGRLSGLGLAQPERLGAAPPELVEEALHYALAASALTCTRHGADPPTAGELASWRQG